MDHDTFNELCNIQLDLKQLHCRVSELISDDGDEDEAPESDDFAQTQEACAYVPECREERVRIGPETFKSVGLAEGDCAASDVALLSRSICELNSTRKAMAELKDGADPDDRQKFGEAIDFVTYLAATYAEHLTDATSVVRNRIEESVIDYPEEP